MIRQVFAIGIAMGLAREPSGCGRGDSQLGGINAPCTRDHDCGESLRCTHGVCEAADGGGDAGGDSAQTKDAPGDG